MSGSLETANDQEIQIFSQLNDGTNRRVEVQGARPRPSFRPSGRNDSRCALLAGGGCLPPHALARPPSPHLMGARASGAILTSMPCWFSTDWPSPGSSPGAQHNWITDLTAALDLKATIDDEEGWRIARVYALAWARRHGLEHSEMDSAMDVVLDGDVEVSPDALLERK